MNMYWKTLVTICVCLSTSVVLAQQTAEAEDVGEEALIEEIIVTAQKRSESLQDVPVSITALSSDTLNSIGAVGLHDIEYATPNLNFGDGARQVRGYISIRGVGDESRNIGTEVRAGVYVDGVYLGRSQSVNSSLLDVERVEVLRGPQGTLFGKNTVSGAINITTQKPYAEFGGWASLGTGNYGLLDAKGSINIPFTDRFYGSVSMQSLSRDGYIDNIFLDTELNERDLTSWRAQLLFIPMDNLEIRLSFDGLTEDIDSTGEVALGGAGDMGGHFFAPDPREVAFDLDTFEKRDLSGTALHIDYEFNSGFTLSSITALRNAEFSEVSEEDYAPYFVASSDFNEDSDQLTQEFRLISPNYDNFDYVVGLYYFDQDASTTRSASLGPAATGGPILSAITPGTTNAESYAAYFHGNYRFTDRFALTGGLRYTSEKKNINYSIIDQTGFFTTIIDFQDSRKDNEWSPKIGLNFDMNDDVMLYVSYSEGFKSGGWNADFITTVEQIAFDPEFATNYEFGMKSSWLNQRLRLNGALFHTEYDDYQVFQFVQTSGSGTIFTLTNAGEVTAEGLELELTVAATSNLLFTAALGLVDASFDTFKDGGGPGIDYDGNTLPYAPDTTFSLLADWEIPIGSAGSVLLHGDYRYSDSFWSDSDNSDFNFVPSYDLWNARLAYLSGGGRWEVAAWIRNISDSTFLRSKSLSFLGVPRGHYSMPRTYGLEARFNF